MHHRSGQHPGVVFTDRGQGFFNISNGKITPQYAGALREHGLRTFMGADGSQQPGDLKELMLHETAVACLTRRLAVTTPARAWEETVPAFGRRLQEACKYVNRNFKVDNLCWDFPHRVRDLIRKEGGRLSK